MHFLTKLYLHSNPRNYNYHSPNHITHYHRDTLTLPHTIHRRRTQ